MNLLESINAEGLRYNRVIGTGGIGSGIFFSLTGDHTLGRNESRMAALLPYRDYCKQHIILHYISKLVGAGRDSFHVFPIGAVGNDDAGKKLLDEMKAADLDLRSIIINAAHSTLFSVCFQYPDHSGGNITTGNSASSKVSSKDIEHFFNEIDLDNAREIILAAPEVPVETRIRLLQYGRRRKSLNIAAVLSAETNEFSRLQGFELTDILSVNMDEVRHIAGLHDEAIPAGELMKACVDKLITINPAIIILATNGAHGSYCYKNNYIEYIPALKTKVISTAGAGDAFLAGTVAGICCGLPFVKGVNDSFFGESPLESAPELGTLLASLSVNSCHTIHPQADATQVYRYATSNKLQLSKNFLQIFKHLVV